MLLFTLFCMGVPITFVCVHVINIETSMISSEHGTLFDRTLVSYSGGPRFGTSG